jgi:hypothetical protein
MAGRVDQGSSGVGQRTDTGGHAQGDHHGTNDFFDPNSVRPFGRTKCPVSIEAQMGSNSQIIMLLYGTGVCVWSMVTMPRVPQSRATGVVSSIPRQGRPGGAALPPYTAEDIWSSVPLYRCTRRRLTTNQQRQWFNIPRRNLSYSFTQWAPSSRVMVRHRGCNGLRPRRTLVSVLDLASTISSRESWRKASDHVGNDPCPCSRLSKVSACLM